MKSRALLCTALGLARSISHSWRGLGDASLSLIEALAVVHGCPRKVLQSTRAVFSVAAVAVVFDLLRKQSSSIRVPFMDNCRPASALVSHGTTANAALPNSSAHHICRAASPRAPSCSPTADDLLGLAPQRAGCVEPPTSL